jgi:hypothetical protein
MRDGQRREVDLRPLVRSEIAVALIERELVVLPHLVPTLPLTIPAPVFSGDTYPWPFLGTRFLPGSELGSAELNEVAERVLESAAELPQPKPSALVHCDHIG